MKRPFYIQAVDESFDIHPITAILGPRQCGKTTLARHYSDAKSATFFDLENPRDLAALDNPVTTLESLTGLIVIDEVQRCPDLFPILRVLVDNVESQQRYLILGSASRDLIRQSSESLAGRIGYIELPPFTLSETQSLQDHWLRGGFPRSFLGKSDDASYRWREAYITTYLEQDIPNLGFRIPANVIRRFWMMLAHYHGQLYNASEIGNALGVSHTAIKHYLSILTGTFMVRELKPWKENIKKRQVKTPKIYIRDAGILHNLLGIETQDILRTHPKIGASWEGFALEEIIQRHHATAHECYFWRTHNGAELDLLLCKKGKKLGFEFKYSDAPTLTPSMKYAMKDLNLDKLNVIYPGNRTYMLAENIEVIGLDNYSFDRT